MGREESKFSVQTRIRYFRRGYNINRSQLFDLYLPVGRSLSSIKLIQGR